MPFLFASFALFFIWITLLLFSHDTRKEQLLMSTLGLIVSPGAIYFASLRHVDAVQSIGIDSLIFAFSLFGIAAVAYEASLSKHARKLSKAKREVHPRYAHYAIHIVVMLAAWLVITGIAIALTVPVLQALIVGGLAVGIYVIADRKDLLFDALFSALVIAILVFLVERVFFVELNPAGAISFWNPDGLSGLFVGGVPVEEILWAATVGFAIGPLYEYVRNLKIR